MILLARDIYFFFFFWGGGVSILETISITLKLYLSKVLNASLPLASMKVKLIIIQSLYTIDKKFRAVSVLRVRSLHVSVGWAPLYGTSPVRAGSGRMTTKHATSPLQALPS